MTKFIDRLKLKPHRMLVIGFALIMLTGGILLNLPISSVDRDSVGFINALFTSVSATSVTGLIVVNTAHHWSLFGKTVILCLIQIGGLGFMTLTTLIAMILGKKIGLKDRLIIQEELNQFNLSGVVKLVKYVVKATFVIEITGAVILASRFIPQYGILKGSAFAVFHSVSAYCNAGFDIIGDSLVGYAGDPLVILTISGLIIIGGIGYTVYIDIANSRKFGRLSVHSKFAIIITALLLVGGTLFILATEWSNAETLRNMTLGEKVLAAFMQSVTTRTAGFNSIDLSHIRPATAFCMKILMFIGGSPGSTAGGIKTTTFGTLMVAVFSIVRGKREAEVLKRTIPKDLVLRALAVAFASGFLVVFMVMAMTITENKEFLAIVYETVSAFSTCGVTMGITSDLTDIGKVLMLTTMYVGKVGPLTLAFAIAKRSSNLDGNYKYPDGKIIIG